MDLKSLVGKGIRSAEDVDLRPQYDMERLDAITQGLPFPDYQTWKKMKQQPQPVAKN